MVNSLPPPVRPIAGGDTFVWEASQGPMMRIYHHDARSPTGVYRRSFGPVERFDHHTPPHTDPACCPQGRSILYLGADIGTCGAEVFGDVREANICPRFRAVVAIPREDVLLQELVGPPVMAIGAVVGLGAGDVPRRESQAWAQAIYEDNPSGYAVHGVHYLASHDGGEASAIWDRAPHLEVPRHPEGLVGDVPLTYPPVWRRFIKEMRVREIVVRRVSTTSCRRCEQVPSAGGSTEL